MKGKIFPTFLIIIFLIIFFVFFKGLQTSTIYTPNSNIQKDIPKFEAKIFEKKLKISSKKLFKSKKFYLVNIWASWCTPCRDEHPFLMNLSKKKNLEIIGLNYKDDDIKARLFLNELKNPYNIIITDKDGTLSIEWGAYGVPESFLIYNEKILKKIIGPINETLLLEIKELIE